MFQNNVTAKRASRVQIANLTRKTILASSVEVADCGPSRNKGLLGRDVLAPDEGLWIVPCEAVHTFGMKFSIDLVYIDRRKIVKKVRASVRPWRLSGCFTAHSIIELASGTIQASLTHRGDVLEISPIEDL